MNKVSRNRRRSKKSLGGLGRRITSKVAPLFAPFMPDRYYEIYRKNLALATEQLQVLSDLPQATFERGYVPLLLASADEARTGRRIWDALAQSPRLLVFGSVGSGKSTLLRSLAWEFANHPDPAFVRHLTFRLFGQAFDELVPVLVDLRAFGESPTSLDDAMLDSMTQNGFPAAGDFLRQRLEAGQCLLLLDGLESVRKPAKQAQIAEMVSAYPQNIWLITARPLPSKPDLPGFSTFRLEGIDGTDIPTYLRHNLLPDSAGASDILAACERSTSLAQLARTPLMIATMCRVLLQGNARSAGLPLLIDACVRALLGEWASRSGYRSRYAASDKLRLLQYIAYKMQVQGRADLDFDEIVELTNEQLPARNRNHATSLCEELIWHTGILFPSNGSQNYVWAAAAFQSYLAARWIVDNHQSASLMSFVDSPWWRDTIVLTAGLLSEPVSFLSEVESHGQEEPYKWFLLANCIAELSDGHEALRERVADHLFALLESGPDETWERAAIAIAGMDRRQAKDHFVPLIGDGSAETRRRAALTLGRLQQEWAIPALGAAISDADPVVRQQAAWALGYIPSSQAVRVLPRALRSPFKGVREAAARSLAMLGQESGLRKVVVQQLIISLGDAEEEAARLAEEALSQIGQAAMPQLMVALDDRRLRGSQRSRIARALGRLGDERALSILIDAIRRGDSEDIGSYIEAVAGIGAAAVPSLIAGLEGKDITTGAASVAALVKIGTPSVGPLIEAIAGNVPEVRNAAVRALEQIGAPAIEPLTHALLHDSRFEVRRRALEILGQIGEVHVVSALIEALDDDDPGVRVNAIRHLGNLGEASAVGPLVRIVSSDKDSSLRRTAVASLGAIGDAQAIPTLIDALEDPPLCQVGANALAELGQEAIEPLIERLHTLGTEAQTRQVIWDVLRRLGARARPGDPNLLGLASTYGKLGDETLSPDEVLALTESLDWWTFGRELHQTLATAHSLAGARDLRAISECGLLLDWLSGPVDWLRPHVKDMLWHFKDVVESVRLYRTLTRRDSQRDALLSCIDMLAELQQRIQEDALPFEQAFLSQVVQYWRVVILEAIRQLRGRASLLIELLTPNLPVRASQHVTTAVFRLFNEGDSAARNLSVTLRPTSKHGIEVVGGEHRDLDPLGIGEERHVEVSIAPNGARQSELLFEVHYDDDERSDVTHRFSCHLEFFDAPSAYVPIESSPYIAGTPVKTAEMFFGRQDIFDWVRDNISSKHQENVLILYGERRMGKTSVLYQLQQNAPTPQHVCLLFDLQLYGYINTVQEFLFELARVISTRLRREGLDFEDPAWERYQSNPYRAFLDLCASLDSRLGERRLVVMADEFGVLMSKVRDGVFEASIFDYLRGVIQRANKLTFLFTGAYEVRRMQKDYGSILFNMAKVRKISYLSQGEATELIEKPVQGLLVYHPLVIQKIRTVTACHPYFTQYICDDLVQVARAARKNYVELSDLDYVIRDVVHDATGNIENSIYNYLGDAEKLALAALANVTDDVRVFVPFGEIATMLERRQLSLPRDELMQALKTLEGRDLVTEMRIGQQLRYSFRMGLVRTWLRQNETLLRLSEERKA